MITKPTTFFAPENTGGGGGGPEPIDKPDHSDHPGPKPSDTPGPRPTGNKGGNIVVPMNRMGDFGIEVTLSIKFVPVNTDQGTDEQHPGREGIIKRENEGGGTSNPGGSTDRHDKPDPHPSPSGTPGHG